MCTTTYTLLSLACQRTLFIYTMLYYLQDCTTRSRTAAIGVAIRLTTRLQRPLLHPVALYGGTAALGTAEEIPLGITWTIPLTGKEEAALIGHVCLCFWHVSLTCFEFRVVMCGCVWLCMGSCVI
jgi:hypothetical protein